MIPYPPLTASSAYQDEGSFASVANDTRYDFKDLALPQVYPATIELFQQDSAAQEVFLIERGLVKLIRLEQEGRELITHLGSSGWLLGASSVIMQEPYAVTAITLTKCSLRRISGEAFRDRLRTDSQFSWYLHQRHSQEILDQMIHVAQLGCLSARHRLEQLFLYLISALELNVANNEIRMHAPLKHWEVAELVAVTPEHLSRMLRQMETEGVLRREKGWLIFSTSHWFRH
ncbi:MAG TPA: Crp/Fnr family transcriptional regulator [Pyrinomonadaceae bacterium]|jgi:CRP/FNR family transcriptional regulator